MQNKITLSNGVRIVYETIPYVRSASVGIWVNSGTRDELAAENGTAHYIEHMVFKGTSTRTAQQLALAMDRMGGQVNAFTTKENTCFYGHVLDTHVTQLGDILCDMLMNSRFDEQDADNERNVILEEIGMYEDTPDDLVTERLFGGCFRGSPLARPVLGTEKTLSGINGAFLKQYLANNYTGRKIIVALSGNVSESDVQFFADRLSSLPAGDGANRLAASYKPWFGIRKKPTEQNHIVLAFPGIAITDENRFAVQLMNGIFGSEMSSRLFQSVREENGLCYSIYSFTSAFTDTGLFGIYTALNREMERPALELIVKEIKRLKSDGVTADELSFAREQVKANLLMSLESTHSRMNRLGNNELYFGRFRSIDESIAGYDAVTPDDIVKAAELIFDFDKTSFSAVGRTDTTDNYREFIGGLLA